VHLSGLLVAITILIALSFDFINGFHDAANSIATVVFHARAFSSTRSHLGCILQLRCRIRLWDSRCQDHRRRSG